VNTGGRYNPSTDTWTPTSTISAPSARGDQTAIWSGSQMIVWGGIDESSVRLNTGGKYDPANDTWTATNTANAPEARNVHSAVWSGTR
jgi:N-acetylneuraminic acid mutarotase